MARSYGDHGRHNEGIVNGKAQGCGTWTHDNGIDVDEGVYRDPTQSVICY